LKAGTLVEDLILHDNVNFIVDPGIGMPHLCATETLVTERYKMPYICGPAPVESWESLRGAVETPWDHTWTIQFAVAEPAEPGSFWDKPGYTMMGAMLGPLKTHADEMNNRVAAFASDDPDGRGWYVSFSAAAEKEGFDVYGNEKEIGLVPIDITDFASLIKEWKEYDCDILWVNAPAFFFGILWRQCKVEGFQPKIVLATKAALFYTDVKAWGGDLPNGICNEMFWHPSIKDSQGIGDTTPMSFHERWVEATGQSVHQNSGFAYAYMQVLFDAIERAGTIDNEKVNMALRDTDMITLYQRVLFNDKNICRVPVGFGQWQKSDKPYVWDNPIIYSDHEFMPASAEMIFPIPY